MKKSVKFFSINDNCEYVMNFDNNKFVGFETAPELFNRVHVGGADCSLEELECFLEIFRAYLRELKGDDFHKVWAKAAKEMEDWFWMHRYQRPQKNQDLIYSLRHLMVDPIEKDIV